MAAAAVIAAAGFAAVPDAPHARIGVSAVGAHTDRSGRARLPSLSVGDARVVEGDTAARFATFTVRLAGRARGPIRVRYRARVARLRGGRAPATAADFVPTRGVLRLRRGERRGAITIPIRPDRLDEPDEAFVLVLSAPKNARLGDRRALGTIVDDDPAPSLTVGDTIVRERGGGSVALFTAELSRASGRTVTVAYTTRSGTANSGADFNARAGKLVFEPGATSRQISVPVADDSLDEADEGFALELSQAVNADIADGAAAATILDDDTSAVTINDVSVGEPNPPADATATFAVTLSVPNSRTVTVNYATANGTAVNPADYAATSGTLTFGPGETTRQVQVAVKGDLLAEDNETFVVSLSLPPGAPAVIGDGQGVGTIADNDPLPTLSLGDVSVTEGNSGTVSAGFVVSLSPGSGRPVTVLYATANRTATAGADYEPRSGLLTFAPGETAKTVDVNVKGDALDEADETFALELSTPGGATITDSEGIATIVDDDPLPALAIADASVTEGNAGTHAASFNVTLGAVSGRTVTVNYTTAGGTAVSPDDYTAASGTLTFTPGQTSKTVAVAIIGETRYESNEIFNVNLSSPTGATLGDGQAVGTITNDDPLPTISIGDASATEGNVGTAPMNFVVSLTNPSYQTITVDYATQGGSATSDDFVALNGTLTFSPGQTTKTVGVQVNGDTLDETNETLALNLSSPVNATLNPDFSGLGTILDDDTSAVTITDVSATEPDPPTNTTVTFTVTLSVPNSRTVSVNYASANGTATDPADYLGTSGTLVFAPLQTTRTIVVTVKGDLVDEDDETFLMNLSLPAGAPAVIGDGQGVGTIVDNDAPSGLSISDVTVAEGNSGTVNADFTVTLSPASGRQVAVDVATADGTATAPADYTTTTQTPLVFNAGETAKTFTVPVNGDAVDEPDEAFTVNLTNGVNATIGDAEGIGTITDDDAAPTLAVADSSVAEGNSGARPEQLLVALSSASGKTITVDYASADGTATAPGDYDTTTGTLTFAPGEAVKAVDVPVNGDTALEPNETFSVDLATPTNATVADGHAVGTINDDDGAAAAAVPAPIGPSTGATFYVSPLGDDANPGTELSPWRTIQKAVDSLAEGQRALVRAGVYNENVLYDPTAGHGVDGTSADPITVRNYPGEQPILRPALVSPSYPLRLKGSYFRFQGFVVEGASTDNTVNVFITDEGSSGGADHIELSDCEIRDALRSSGIFVHWQDVHDVQLLRNRVHDNNEAGVQHQGIYLESSDSVIANNVVYNQTHGFGIQVRSPDAGGPRNVLVANNTTADNSIGGIVVEHTAVNVKVVNNVSAFNGTGILGYFSVEDHPLDPLGGGNEAWNNLLFANGTSVANSGGRPILNFHDNTVGEDPLFVNRLLGDFHLQASSPAIGAAVPTWSPLDDADGRPRDSLPDLGAYESIAAGAPSG